MVPCREAGVVQPSLITGKCCLKSVNSVARCFPEISRKPPAEFHLCLGFGPVLNLWETV